MKRRLLQAVLVTTFLASCGTDRDMTEAAQGALEPKVAEVRSAAEARDAGALQSRLTELRSLVGTLQDQGEISEQSAQRVLDAATEVESQSHLITTTTAPPTTVAPEPPNKDEEKDEEEKKGRGKGDD